MGYKTFTNLYFSQGREVELIRKQSAECETVAKTQGKYLVKKGVMAMCNKILIFLYRKRVFNCGVWPPYNGGQLHGFYCPVLKKTDCGVLTH